MSKSRKTQTLLLQPDAQGRYVDESGDDPADRVPNLPPRTRESRMEDSEKAEEYYYYSGLRDGAVQTANELVRVFAEEVFRAMTHVVTAKCFDCKYTDCLVVCPVECFYEGDQMLFIHPDECIDCEACVPECPVEAIYHEDNVPEEYREFIALNAEMALQSPSISDKHEPIEGPSCSGRT